jgi:hypothetical protein
MYIEVYPANDPNHCAEKYKIRFMPNDTNRIVYLYNQSQNRGRYVNSSTVRDRSRSPVSRTIQPSISETVQNPTIVASVSEMVQNPIESKLPESETIQNPIVNQNPDTAVAIYDPAMVYDIRPDITNLVSRLKEAYLNFNIGLVTIEMEASLTNNPLNSQEKEMIKLAANLFTKHTI